MCLFGLAKIGAVMVPMNEQYRAEEAAFVLERTEASCAVIEPKFLDLYAPSCAMQAGGFPKGVLVARTHDDNVEGAEEACAALAADLLLRDFTALRAERRPLSTRCELSSDDPAEIIFTSGTTSRPKGVVLTHANILFSGLYADWEVSLTKNDRLLTTMPACHSNFQLAALMPVLTAGATLIVIEKYSASRFWSQIREFRATVTQCVAMMLRTLMLQPASPEDRDHELREILYFLPVTTGEGGVRAPLRRAPHEHLRLHRDRRLGAHRPALRPAQLAERGARGPGLRGARHGRRRRGGGPPRGGGDPGQGRCPAAR